MAKMTSNKLHIVAGGWDETHAGADVAFEISKSWRFHRRWRRKEPKVQQIKTEGSGRAPTCGVAITLP